MIYFVDASIEDIKDVIITKIEPDNVKVEFSMHTVSPAYVVDLCKKMYNKTPEANLIHIKGYGWDFMEDITEKAKENLEMALKYWKKKVSGVLERNDLRILYLKRELSKSLTNIISDF